MNWSEEDSRRFHRLMGIREKTKPHNPLPINLVALARRMKNRVNLNIVDMTELVRGWDATRPGVLEPKNAIIAGTDMVSVDAYCVRIFGEDPLGRWQSARVDNYIRIMHEAGIGNADVQTLSVIKTVI